MLHESHICSLLREIYSISIFNEVLPAVMATTVSWRTSGLMTHPTQQISEDLLQEIERSERETAHLEQFTELLNYYTNQYVYKIYKILHIKTLKTILHVSVLRPSSGSYIFLAKFTL